MKCATSQSYDVVLSHGVLAPRNRSLADAIGGRPALVVADSTVARLVGDALAEYLATVPSDVGVHLVDVTEQTKSIAAVVDVCGAAQRHGLRRRDPLVALGGGICTDVVSVAASLIRRGVPYVCVPTTLIGQVDAGIGLKGAVNFGGSKNYLGCFAPPSRVLIDPTFLRTVPPEDLRAGLAEIVKVALVLDAALFERLGEIGGELVESGFRSPAGDGDAVVARSIELMLDQLARNPYEDLSLERLVDFGHTFSGRLEEASGHRLRHGEAVAIDIALTCALGVELGLLAENDFEAVVRLLSELGLPVHTPLLTLDVALEGMAAAMRHRDGALNLVVPTAIGAAVFVRSAADVPDAVLRAAIARVAVAAERALSFGAADGLVA